MAEFSNIFYTLICYVSFLSSFLDRTIKDFLYDSENKSFSQNIFRPITCLFSYNSYRIISTVSKSSLLILIRQPMLIQISQIVIKPSRIICQWNRFIFRRKHVNRKDFVIPNCWVNWSEHEMFRDCVDNGRRTV